MSRNSDLLDHLRALMECGYIAAGSYDDTICFFCGELQRRLLVGEPKHGHHSPHCPYESSREYLLEVSK